MNRALKTTEHKVMEYIALFQEEKEGGFSVWVPDLPGCASQGESFEEASVNIQEAIKLYLEETKNYCPSDLSYKRQFTVPIQVYA
ncbi:type II toxin-antitoxin system HicB family antitoxin [Candidatus Microgenomates bacterium]|nr:type II toxin-antitoxin system HicB family antitoxin [Candidatus Microgenomates bacterium]